MERSVTLPQNDLTKTQEKKMTDRPKPVKNKTGEQTKENSSRRKIISTQRKKLNHPLTKTVTLKNFFSWDSTNPSDGRRKKSLKRKWKQKSTMKES